MRKIAVIPNMIKDKNLVVTKRLITYLEKYADVCVERTFEGVLPQKYIFDDIFEVYVKNYSIESVKTVNLGSLFEITYMVNMKKDINEKKFIDDIRCRNGNLKIVLTHSIENGEL